MNYICNCYIYIYICIYIYIYISLRRSPEIQQLRILSNLPSFQILRILFEDPRIKNIVEYCRDQLRNTFAVLSLNCLFIIS